MFGERQLDADVVERVVGHERVPHDVELHILEERVVRQLLDLDLPVVDRA